MRRSLLLCGLVVAFLLVCPTGAMARGALPELPAQVKALLDGDRIPLKEVVNHHCHDLTAPTYRCFDTEAERDADALAFLGEQPIIAPLSSLSFTFALVYAAANYGGSSLMISAPTPDLGVVGWNNVISSFKSTNGGRPKWWSGFNYSGSASQWPTSAWVPYVGDLVDNTFSSVKNVP
ncbi:MAG: hypothetical protein ABI797_02705 [Chloroflexota bacterium]